MACIQKHAWAKIRFEEKGAFDRGVFLLSPLPTHAIGMGIHQPHRRQGKGPSLSLSHKGGDDAKLLMDEWWRRHVPSATVRPFPLLLLFLPSSPLPSFHTIFPLVLARV
jgi:hypothetical protein